MSHRILFHLTYSSACSTVSISCEVSRCHTAVRDCLGALFGQYAVGLKRAVEFMAQLCEPVAKA